jgi:ubiquinone/menaquinone biosynthesis C-methylase UbiE
MVHKDHVQLISLGIDEKIGIWADLGSGEGAFTFALADLTDQKAEIYSIDKSNHSLKQQQREFESKFPFTKINFIKADFTKPLDLPPLDGILMANSLHYVKDQKSFLKNIKQYLKPGGKLILVEYNVDKGNYWVPFPLSFDTFEKLVEEAGFKETKLIGQIPSSFLNEIYAAETTK